MIKMKSEPALPSVLASPPASQVRGGESAIYTLYMGWDRKEENIKYIWSVNKGKIIKGQVNSVNYRVNEKV